MVLIQSAKKRRTQLCALEVPIRSKIGTGNSPNHEAWHWRCSEHSHGRFYVCCPSSYILGRSRPTVQYLCFFLSAITRWRTRGTIWCWVIIANYASSWNAFWNTFWCSVMTLVVRENDVTDMHHYLDQWYEMHEMVTKSGQNWTI